MYMNGGDTMSTNTNATNFRQNVFEYLSQVVLYNDIIHVNTKNGNAVVLSEDDYRAMTETLYLLSHPKTAQEIMEAKTEPLEAATPYDEEAPW